jgi:hypothetical protein
MLQSSNKACKSQTSVGLKDNKKNVHHQALKTIKNWISQFPKKKEEKSARNIQTINLRKSL